MYFPFNETLKPLFLNYQKQMEITIDEDILKRELGYYFMQKIQICHFIQIQNSTNGMRKVFAVKGE